MMKKKYLKHWTPEIIYINERLEWGYQPMLEISKKFGLVISVKQHTDFRLLKIAKKIRSFRSVKNHQIKKKLRGSMNDIWSNTM